MASLRSLLKEKFGFDDFRPSQEQVCEAVAAGYDVLLVMPTGAGKSLCYQLPGLARGGVTLVISPLLALIDDQVAKLRKMGLRAEQIHSGRSREDSRNACIQYLRGELDFLFVAPERLAVRGFLEMLEKRKPTLIAVDEAHCISQWGHDFRPEYRKLSERLVRLRPAPILALTATATPIVQDDILQQLGVPAAKRFIQGFRRTNIAIRVHEVPVPSRGRACQTLLSAEGKTPAIIYAQTRKAAEEIATELKSQFRAEAYHAGMTPEARDRVQTNFLSGKFDVIVATVAFGMGIDKSNIRSVIHAGLPGSVEGYYQEIGRAGRDGNPSEAILLHSFADQKTHDFFFERDYPETQVLRLIYESTGISPLPKDEVLRKANKKTSEKLDSDSFDKALEKLWFHGGVLVDPEENVTIGDPVWMKTYEKQRNHRAQSVQQMLAFIRNSECRMLFFLKHFGDRSDKKGACESCDLCVDDSASSRALNENERVLAVQILASLSETGSYSAGRLFDEVNSSQSRSTRGSRDVSRKDFEALLDLMARVKWVAIRQESFEKDGKTIAYRKVELNTLGESVEADDIDELRIQDSPWMAAGSASGSRKRKKKTAPLKRSHDSSTHVSDPEIIGASSKLIDQLRNWRLTKAREQGIPAFRIFSDRVLHAIAAHRPSSLDELLEIQGFGPKLRDKYGSDILGCLAHPS